MLAKQYWIMFSGIANQLIIIFLMKKTIQHKSKQLLNTIQQPSQHYDPNNTSKRYPKDNRSPSNLRYIPSHPFSQVKIQHLPYPKTIHHIPHDSRIQHNNGQDFHKYYRVKQNKKEYVPTENIILLRQRLKNIHDYYKEMINDEKAKNAEKGQVIIGLLTQMQNTHNQKVQSIRKMIQDSEQQKRDVGFVDDKMNEIKGNIDELIGQSNTLKVKNEELQKLIADKSRTNQQKQTQLQELNQQLLDARTELQHFELANLKNNKINKEIIQIFNSASTIALD